MKTTTRLYDILYSYYNRLYGDFKRDNRIIFFDNDFQFMHKVANYDDEIKSTCRDTIFYGLDFLDEEPRTLFESEFLTRFMNRSIKFQTSSQFNLRLISYCRGIQTLLQDYYTNMEKLARGNEYSITHSEDTANSTTDNEGISQTSSNDTSKQSSTNRNGNAVVSLPQDTALYDLTTDEIQYADSVAQGKTKDSSEGINTSFSKNNETSTQVSNSANQNDSNTESWKFDTKQLEALKQFHDNLFIELDKQLFSQMR